MKKLLVFAIIMTSLIFGVQGFSQMNSKEFEKVIEKVSEEYDKGNRQKAISMLKEDIQKNPTNVVLKAVLGMLYDDMGKKNESEKELNEAIEMQKKYPFIADDGKKYDIRLLTGIVYMGMEEYEKALKWLSKIDNKNFGSIDEIDFIMGYLNYRLENTEEAKKYLLKSYVKDEEGMSQNILGQIYLAEGNQKEARKWFLESSDKGNSGGQANLGILYYQQRDKNTALKWLKKSFETAKKQKDQKQMKDIQEIIKEVESNN
ncbi:tetratricopeptide repeat protein [Leptotrichia hongkongensis]|uniref:Tetratricopeptide repeat protein n=1 Tax=Leptotrichia hongkongensis TaxID=554406 RepID=A0ABV4S9L4_9FUSO